MRNTQSAARPRPSRGLNVALWVLQGLLAVFFLFAGWNHGVRPLDQALTTSPWIAELAPALVRFIGWAELAGGLGLVLPAATRIVPALTPLAAVGVAIIMALAIPFHIMLGEANVIGLHIVVVALSLVVAWGRFRRLSIQPRA